MLFALDPHAANPPDLCGEQLRKLCAVQAPEPETDGLERDEQTNAGDDDRFFGRIENRPDNQPKYDGAQNEADRNHDEDRKIERHTPLIHLPAQINREGRHLALGKVDDAGRAVNEDESQRKRRVNRARRQTVDDLLEEQRHAASPKYARLISYST